MRLGRIPLPVLLSAFFVFIFTCLFNTLVFQNIPHVHDEIGYLFQAKIFKLGHLAVPLPCAKEFFEFPHIINDAKWYTIYPPGHPFLLLLGLLVGAPWIIGPLLASFAIILFFFLGKTVYGEKDVGILASILGASSIWLLLMSSTMMSHTSSLFFSTLFLLFLAKSKETPSLRNGLAAGAGIGMAFLIRPYNAVLFSAVYLFAYSISVLKDFHRRWKNAAAMGAVILAFGLLLAAYNGLTNGHPLRMGYATLKSEVNTIGFGRTASFDSPFMPAFSRDQIMENVGAISAYLFGWPVSSLLALIPLLLLYRIDRRGAGKDLWLIGGIIPLFIGYYFYWGAFVFIGARMFFEIVPVLVILSARGILGIPRLVASARPAPDPGRIRKAVFIGLAVFVLYAFVISFPRWVRPSDTEAFNRTFDRNFSLTTARIDARVRSLLPGRSLVLMRFLYYPEKPFPTGQWGSGFAFNDPELKGRIIYALDRPGSYGELRRCYPDRDFFLYYGTYDLGSLVALRIGGGGMTYGDAFPPAAATGKMVALTNNYDGFFKGYSEAFRNFLANLAGEFGPFEIDVAGLAEAGLRAKEGRDVRSAAFFFEAALQVERNPTTRFSLLNQVLSCYTRIGDLQAAQRVQRTLIKAAYDAQKVYHVIPERGF